MSFAAEPYGVFVDDLVSSLTGGVTRERFTFSGRLRHIDCSDNVQAQSEHGGRMSSHRSFGCVIATAQQHDWPWR